MARLAVGPHGVRSPTHLPGVDLRFRPRGELATVARRIAMRATARCARGFVVNSRRDPGKALLGYLDNEAAKCARSRATKPLLAASRGAHHQGGRPVRRASRPRWMKASSQGPVLTRVQPTPGPTSGAWPSGAVPF